MDKDETAHAQLELLADFQDKAIKARIDKAAAERVESIPYPEGTETVHRLKITLRNMKPPVWRRITPAEPGVTYPLCTAGRRACPPEDCGGPSRYAEILAALRDRQYPNREGLLATVLPGFDPARFDLQQAQAALRAPRPLEDW